MPLHAFSVEETFSLTLFVWSVSFCGEKLRLEEKSAVKKRPTGHHKHGRVDLFTILCYAGNRLALGGHHGAAPAVVCARCTGHRKFVVPFDFTCRRFYPL